LSLRVDNAAVFAILPFRRAARRTALPILEMRVARSMGDHHRTDVRIGENGFATSSGMSKSAKVVLGPVFS
jgi:hypothetical protein